MPRSAKKHLTALQIFLAPNLLSKVRSYDASCRTKFSNAESSAYKFKINLSLECGIYNARQKFPGWVVLNVRPIRGIFVSGSR